MMFGRRESGASATRLNCTRIAPGSARCSSGCEREHGVTHYLAHNMTVTPRNVDQVAGVIEQCRDLGFRMFSFQPAAFVGNANRWKDDYRDVSSDAVWAQIERGAGARLHWRALQVGDQRCNRSAYGAFVGDRYVPLLDEDDPGDAHMLRAFLRAFGGMDFERGAHSARNPHGEGGRGVTGFSAGGSELGAASDATSRRHPCPAGRAAPRPVTFVMHSFMDARVVRPAWDALQRGIVATEPEVREAQERLQACSYAMAHPEDGTLVPACAQHSVLDPGENARLAVLLPIDARHEKS